MPAPSPAASRADSSTLVGVPMSRLPSLVLGLVIGVGVATAGYLVLLLLGR
jgi:hypothetical protein